MKILLKYGRVLVFIIMDMLEIKINAANYALSSNLLALVEPAVQSILSIKHFLKQVPH